MRITSVIGAGLACLSLSAQAQAPAGKSRPLSLKDCIQIALEHNLDLQIERFNPQASMYNLNGYYSYYDPLFTQDISHSFNSSPGGIDSRGVVTSSEQAADRFNTALSGRTPIGMTYALTTDFASNDGSNVGAGSQYSSGMSVRLTQHLLKDSWIDSGRANIKLGKLDFRFAELGVRNRVMTVVNAVQRAYFDLIFAIENVKVQQKALELADKLLQENKKKVEVGALAPLEEKQAESQAAKAKSDLLTARLTLSGRQNDLKKLLTDDFAQWHDLQLVPTDALVAVPEALDLQQSWTRSMNLRPDLLQSKVDLERRDVTLKYLKNQTLPTLDVFGSMGQNGLGSTFPNVATDLREGDNPRHGYGISFSFPLGNRSARNAYQVRKVELVQAVLQLKQKEQEVLVQVDNLVGTVRNNFEKVDSTRQARLYAEAALEAEQKKLENGKSTSFFVLQLQRDLTNARSAEIQALSDYNKAVSDLSLGEGTILEKNNIQVDVR
jgi:outer membrane protein TolC